MYQVMSDYEGKTWDVSTSKSTVDEAIQIMDQALVEFLTKKPSAKLESVEIEMHLVRDVWTGVLEGLRQRLATLEGEKRPGKFDVPIEINKAVQAVIDRSSLTDEMGNLLRKHGMSMGIIAMSEHVMFKDSLTGRHWSDIAKKPGLGILSPGSIEYLVRK
jgi:hypothetical protein